MPLDRSKRETDGGRVGVHVLLITAVHQLAQLSHPVVAFIANVPQQAQPTTQAQDASDFGDRAVDVNPVPCLSHYASSTTAWSPAAPSKSLSPAPYSLTAGSPGTNQPRQSRSTSAR